MLLRSSGPFRGLGRFLRPHRLPLAAATALVVLQTIIDLAVPWPLKIAVDSAIGGQPLPGWLGPLAGLSTFGLAVAAAASGVGLVALSGVVRYAGAYLSGAAAERIGADMRGAVFDRLLRLSLRFHDGQRSGDLVTRLLSDIPRVQDALASLFHTMVPDTLALLGMIVVLLAIDLELSAAALLVVPLLAVQVAVSRARIKAAEREVRDRHGHLAARATEILRHIRAVQAFGRQDEEHRRFRAEVAATTRSAEKALSVHARYSPIADVILALGAGGVLVLGVTKVVGGEITVGTLLVILTYAANLHEPIRSLTRLSSILARAGASGERLQEILQTRDQVMESDRARPAPDGAAGLALEHVTFGYRDDVPVLRDLSLEVRPGETVCVVGPTGAGKSTLLSLLLRLYDPDAGRVTLAGHDLRGLTLASLRARIALVPQDSWILDGTIADNIRCGQVGATDDEVRAAARLALVDEFAERLPEGYLTVVGESGSRLSGGQRRRIALARALLRGASVLLLDEPTSGLDARSESQVVRALRRASVGRTVMVVTHRLRLALHADRVVVLQRGRVVEQGAPAALLAAGGAFAQLCEEQGIAAPPSRSWIGSPAVGFPTELSPAGGHLPEA